MAERPILFSSPMVRTILDGRKSQTRRVVKPQPSQKDESYYEHGDVRWSGGVLHRIENPRGRDKSAAGLLNERPLVCPYGVPGDRLWVRETWCELDRDGWIDTTKPKDWLTDRYGHPRRNGVAYRSHTDAESERCREELGYRWRPSIHMPRWASRITLEVVSVRVERVREITAADCYAEGFPFPTIEETANYHKAGRVAQAHDWYHELWDSINAKKHPWASNPWVFVVEFKRVLG